MSRFRKKPVAVRAVEFAQILGDWCAFYEETTDKEDLDWLTPALDKPAHTEGALWPHDDGVHLCVGTREGMHVASPDDWLILGVAGEIYPCKPDIFRATYDNGR